MYTLKANLHVHSINSDGIHIPSVIVAYAAFNNIRVLSITDHNEIHGTVRAAKLAEKVGIMFFPGIELMFMIGGRPYEILAYFYDIPTIEKFYKEYRFHNGFAPTFKKIEEVVNMVRKHNGAIVAPHPFGRKGIFRKLRHRGLNVDAIEDVNAFTGERRNKKARRHTDKDNNFLRLGAADMHFFLYDIKKVYTELSAKREFTKRNLWENLLGKKHTISFVPKGDSFLPHKVAFQKPLCVVVYALNYPRLYLRYKIGKRRVKKDL